MSPLRHILRQRKIKGYGVHSPFVYNLLSNVIRTRTSPKEELYVKLRSNGINNRIATQLQNLIYYYPVREVKLSMGGNIQIINNNCTEKANEGTGFFLILNSVKTGGQLLDKLDFTENRTLFAILGAEYSGKSRRSLRNMIADKKCLSIGTRDYMLIFFDDKLPAQHFKF